MNRVDWWFTLGSGLVLVAFYAWLEVKLACMLLPLTCL